MDKETLFKVLFKSDINSEQKFNEFSQLTPAGRRVIILVINLALGGKPSHMARKTCFVDNCSDCLKILNLLSLHSIRKHNRVEKTNNLMNDEEESKLIRSFFENGNSSLLSEMKWNAPTFD